ncbi:MAG: hypothetical protein ACLSA2_00185 [Candidatus Gastranaerophilaceae bacterium]
MQTCFYNGRKHDEAAAMISHMPMLIAQALMLAAKDNLALKWHQADFVI